MKRILPALAIFLAARGFAQLNVTGQWGPVVNLPVVTVHEQYLPNGKVLMWGRGDLADFPTLFDPEHLTITSLGSNGTDMFCSGHTFLSDGTLLVAGGHIADAV